MNEILNNISEQILIVPFVTGSIFAAAAIVTLIFPPKKINYLYGYRTKASMKNQEVWDFSQRFSSIKMLQLGLILMAFSFLNIFMDLNGSLLITVSFSAIIIACAYLFFTTERAIRKKFPNN